MTNGSTQGAGERVARYGKMVASAGRGGEVAELLLAAAAEMDGDPGCELYLVQHETGAPDTIWVTELWRSQADLDQAIAQIRGSESVAQVMALVEAGEAVELTLLGGKGPVPA
ncbi:putative quinol monooxygenase [Conexibacter sp. CPCC 206217]|uniref:putative quinol monooxygenase n=1 Tax=Conexibacter sp. CPCC 206217 TaxID=3064574 RepID=UPI00271AE926|nr:antibiotic biosynthesis monooxygenase [Conexibacter sp. CPCC 206217]MDO8209056.1 antibiotic biosynthesis monooxygenase [Conexibacter sp. CPCC 206217]